MKDMELYVIASAKERETSEQRRHRQRLEDRQRKQMEYNNDKMLFMMAAVCGVLLLVATLGSIARTHQPVQLVEPAETKIEMPSTDVGGKVGNLEVEDDGWVDLQYHRDDIPLSYDLQDQLHMAADTAGIPYELALAVISRETGYRNLIGDDGESAGYMQIQEKWHKDRMKRLGVTDLSVPWQNFEVGCDFLAELLDKYPTEEALTAYNRGTPGHSEYASDVINRWQEILKGGNANE